MKKFKRIAAIVLCATTLISTYVGFGSISASAATVDSTTKEEKAELEQYGDVVSNEELGEIVSYSGYITKEEYASKYAGNSVSA